MRCILVNDARLKTEVCCAQCRRKVNASYVREIGTGLIYCGYHCYCVATAAPVLTFEYFGKPAGSWRLGS